MKSHVETSEPVARAGRTGIGPVIEIDPRFNTFLEYAPDAVVIIDAEGRIVFANAPAERLFGYDRRELLGEAVEILLPQRFKEKHRAHRDGYIPDARLRPMGAGLDLYGRRSDGSEFPVDISLGPLDTDEGLLIAASIRDITERKQLESTLRERNVQLENASQAKDRFLASMSHELRTPLNAIIGFTGTLLMGLPGPLVDEQRDQLSTIRLSARHLLAIINDLLDLAKIESGKVEIVPEAFACHDLLSELESTLHPLATQRGLTFEVKVDQPDLELLSDRRTVTQILLNLANNAIKFTEEGSVTISVARRSEDGGTQTEISVADTGPGIRPEDRARLFEAFERGRAESLGREGTGLGLYISARLAQLIGARIEVDSVDGRGSRFTLVLPDMRKT